jgi:hypothetical protein
VCAFSAPFLALAWAKRKATGDAVSLAFGAASSVSLAVYLFATGMHERYLFPYLLLAIPFAQRGWLQATTYWAISLLYLINLMDHWRPVPWFDALWSKEFADGSARLLVAFGLLHMWLVLHDAWWPAAKSAAAKKTPKRRRAAVTR